MNLTVTKEYAELVEKQKKIGGQITAMDLAKKFAGYQDLSALEKHTDEYNKLGKIAKEIVDRYKAEHEALRNNKELKDDVVKNKLDQVREKAKQDLSTVSIGQQEIIKNKFDKQREIFMKAYIVLSDENQLERMSEKDFLYINAMLSRDDSQRNLDYLANRYNYNYAVLDILNAGNKNPIKHPIELALSSLPPYVDKHSGIFKYDFGDSMVWTVDLIVGQDKIV